MQNSMWRVLIALTLAALLFLPLIHSHPIDDLLLRTNAEPPFSSVSAELLPREPKGKSNGKSGGKVTGKTANPKKPSLSPVEPLASKPKPGTTKKQGLSKDKSKTSVPPTNPVSKPNGKTDPKQPTPSKQDPPKVSSKISNPPENSKLPKGSTDKPADSKKPAVKTPTSTSSKLAATPKTTGASTLQKKPTKSSSSVQPSPTFKGPLAPPFGKCSLATCSKSSCKVSSKAGGKAGGKNGGKSGVKRSDGTESSFPSLIKRAFKSLIANGAVASLRLEATNEDVSIITKANKGLLDKKVLFAETASSMTITQLEGCTAVFLISPKGMYGAHILEFDSYDSNNDLSPEGFESHMRNVANSMRSKAQDLFEGAQLHIMMPITGGRRVYDQLTSPKQLMKQELPKHNNDPIAAEKAIPASKKVKKQISAHIIDTLRNTAGLSEDKVQIHQYVTSDTKRPGVEKSNTGTFVAQFDPQSDDGTGKKIPAIQISINGKPKPETKRISFCEQKQEAGKSIFSFCNIL